jgi:subtilisin inhibitor-like
MVFAVRVVASITLTLVLANAALASGGTSLRIVIRANPTAPARVVTLRCEPAGGTVANPVQACRRLLAAGRAIFAPTPPRTACTQIYGGPQQALVTGTVAGARVWARFGRRDGCELARWNRAAFLFAQA